MPVLRLIRRAFCPDCFPWGLGNLCEDHDMLPHERWAHKVAKLATPDQIIAGNIVASFTKDLSTNWTLHKRKPPKSDPFASDRPDREEWHRRWTKKGSKANYYICDRVLENGKIFIAYCGNNDSSFYVNEVPIHHEDGRFIIKSYTELQNKMAEVKRLADKAKREMEENEAKWNLVESLFKLRRTPEGALVPIYELEAERNNSEELLFLAGPRRDDLDLSFLGP